MGELVKQGQTEGSIAGPGQHARNGGYEQPSDLIGKGRTADEHRVLAGADPKHFDQAVDQARQEGNLSRANVVRKIRDGQTGNNQTIGVGGGIARDGADVDFKIRKADSTFRPGVL